MTQPDQQFIKNPADVAKYAFGSVLSGGDSHPKNGNDAISWTDLYDEFQSRSSCARGYGFRSCTGSMRFTATTM